MARNSTATDARSLPSTNQDVAGRPSVLEESCRNLAGFSSLAAGIPGSMSQDEQLLGNPYEPIPLRFEGAVHTQPSLYEQDKDCAEESISSFKPISNIEAVLSRHIRSSLRANGLRSASGTDFLVHAIMRLEAKIVELSRMIEPKEHAGHDIAQPVAGSIFDTPFGVAMLLVPLKPTEKSSSSMMTKTSRWTSAEDDLLTYAVEQNQRGKRYQWADIASTYFPGTRSSQQVRGISAQQCLVVAILTAISPSAQCKRRWGIIKQKPEIFTAEEDQAIISGRLSGLSFSNISASLCGRTTDQIRARFQVIDPHRKRSPWTDEENQTLLAAQQQLGNSWSQIALRLPGRSSQDVKNQWYNNFYP